jgi:hypothetical protein
VATAFENEQRARLEAAGVSGDPTTGGDEFWTQIAGSHANFSSAGSRKRPHRYTRGLPSSSRTR